MESSSSACICETTLTPSVQITIFCMQIPQHLQWVCDVTEADGYLDTETGKSSLHLDGKGLTPQHQYHHICRFWKEKEREKEEIFFLP